MPIIVNKKESKKGKISVQIQGEILTEIHKYCDWAKVEVDLFFEEAAKFIFKKDKEYINHFKTKSTRGRKTRITEA